MEGNERLENNSRDIQTLGISEKIDIIKVRRCSNLHMNFRQEKVSFHFADLLHETTTIRDMSSKPLRGCSKLDRKLVEEEELIKYMSNLPSYLERGAKRDDKVLNVGVLDWGRLEKWHSQKHISQMSHRHSLSSSNSSSSFSTEGSSVISSVGRSCSPAHQRICRPSLQFHLMSSPRESHSHARKSLEESFGKFPDAKGIRGHAPDVKGQFIRKDPGTDQIRRKKRDDVAKVKSQTGTSTNGVNDEVVHCVKANSKKQDLKFLKRLENFQEQEADIFDKDATQKNEAVVCLKPRNPPIISNPRLPHLSDSIVGQTAAEESRRSFSEIPKEFDLLPLSSCVPHSCPLPQKFDSAIKRCSDVDEVSFLREHSTKKGNDLDFGGTFEVKRSGQVPAVSGFKEHSKGLDSKPIKVASEKPRSTSPFRRLGIGMGKINKNFNSREGLQPASTNRSAKSVSDDTKNSSFQDASIIDAQNSTSRARSSPLRRLFDPLWKPKAQNHCNSLEQLRRNLVPTDRACKSDGNAEFSNGAAQPRTTLESDTTSFQKANNDLTRDKNYKSSQFQALLQVAIKDGQPLYTFAVDNEHDIIAATGKKLSSTREDGYSCIYTFYSIQKVKKKNGRWIAQGGKGKDPAYIHNVVALLKVSGSQFSSLTRQNYIVQSLTREFVLFAVDLRRGEPQALDFQPNDELAAIVVKIPKVINKSSVRHGHQSIKYSDLPGTRSHSTLENEVNLPFFGCQTVMNATMILPSGIHSLPNKGGPSSLIQRWRSGGSCDCGGWDLGCKLRILSNKFGNKLVPPKGRVTDKFEFMYQGEEDEDQPVFSLASFQEGIYSVEFNASLSILQAFSLGIAVIEGKKLHEISEISSSNEEKTSRETVLAQNDGTRMPPPNGMDGGRYVSYPPLSPVGRV
ncbi:hypothetical protein K2173_016485 [Erythroxylum novogranatense]|uniref:DUF3527 domain protein n=1 Tax=Erythroxylum novogranatense TaxID=1862640 RepID=A0AAV8SGL6_9ROSI|nr:hypothetical protein K2173_016485 [Erythroxylum novogranatense]